MKIGYMRTSSINSMILGFLLTLVISGSCFASAKAEIQVTLKSGDWMRYDIITEELNWTGWQRFDLYQVEGTLIKFNLTMYSDKYGLSSSSGQFDMGKMQDYAVYPNDTIMNIVIPANLAPGDTFRFYGLGITTIDGETETEYLGAVRKVIYATYEPPLGMPSEASKIEYKWDKVSGIVLEFNATYPDGKTTYSKIADTNIWQPEQNLERVLIYVISSAAIVAAAAFMVLVFKRRKSHIQPKMQSTKVAKWLSII